MQWLRAAGAATLALGIGAAAAPAARQAPAPSIRVVGFAAIFDNDEKIVHARPGGVLRRCLEPRAFGVVLDVANIKWGSPYIIDWRLPGKVVHRGQGTSGAFDAKPDRIHLGFRKKARLANGPYTFEFYVSGKLLARATVNRKC